MARIIKKTHAENKECILGRGRGGHVFGVGRCLRTLRPAWLVRKTGYMLTLPLTWLRYQCTGLSVGHPLNDPVRVHVYRDDLTNICPVQPDWTDDSTVCLQPPPFWCPDKPNLTFKGVIRWMQRGQKRLTEISYMLVLHVWVYKYSLCTHMNVVCGFC